MTGTYRTLQSAQQRVLAAREELRAQTETSAESEPMRRWPHTIPMAETACSACSACCSCADEETVTILTQALEKLQYQNQVLTDLLSGVNSLTAAVLCQKAPAAPKTRSKSKAEEPAE